MQLNNILSGWRNGLGGWLHGLAHYVTPEQSFGTSWWMVGNQAEVWLDTQNLWKIYTDSPILNSCINKKAEMMAMGRIGLFDTRTGEQILKDPVLDLLDQPNPIQSQLEWIILYSVYYDIYGQLPIFMNSGIPKDVPDQMWILPPALTKVIPTGKVFRQLKIDDVIKEFVLTYNGNQDRFTPSQILFKNRNLSAEYITSQSKILSLAKPLSNIDGALRTANSLINDHGTYGVLSTAGNKDAAGIIPLGAKERARLEDAFKKRYGNRRDQQNLTISEASLNFTPISFKMDEMNLDVEIEQDSNFVYSAYGMNQFLFATSKNATFENQKEGFRSTIQNTIQPAANDLMYSLNKWFKLRQQNKELRMTYDHLPVMQENEVEKQNSNKVKLDYLLEAMTKGVIQPDFVASQMGWAYDDSEQGAAEKIKGQLIAAQMQLRGYVGSLQEIVNINTAVATKIMTRDNGMATLMSMFGFTQQEADAMITTTTVQLPTSTAP